MPSSVAAIDAASRPVLALAMGDPAGVSPELTARLLELPEILETARLVVIGDRRGKRAVIGGILHTP